MGKEDIFDQNEIRVLDFISFCWREKRMIITITAIISILSLSFSFFLTDYYKASSTLVPAEHLASQVSNSNPLASLSGIPGLNISPSDKLDYITLGMKTLESRVFTKSFIARHNLSHYYFAVDYYDKKSKKLVFDKNLYNPDKACTISKEKIPTDQDLFNSFQDSIRFIRNEAENTIKLEVIHESPIFAKEVNDLIIKDLNDEIRRFDSIIADKSIEFVNRKLRETQSSELKETLYGIYKSELRKKMLTEVQDEYIFRVLDPAVIPINKYKPSRLMILIASIISGFVISIISLLAIKLTQKE